MLRDLRFALRLLRHQPGFAAIAVLTLALGIGATAAVFSLIQGVLLTPPPYRNPHQLVLISGITRTADADGPRRWFADQWSDWQQHSRSFESFAPYNWTFNFLVRNDGSESMQGMSVTPDYFRTLGLQPTLGRTFLESEVGPTPAPVIILGHEFWRRKFNADPAIIGKTLRISRRDVPSTVIGVLPPGIRFLPAPGASKEPNYNVNAFVDFWVPSFLDPANRKRGRWDVMGRLRDGVTPAQAQAELAVLVERQARTDPDFGGATPRVEPFSTEINRDGSRILLPLLGAAALVLLIACGNAAALLLVRGLQRQQEYAIRAALGMGRFALLRQVSTESLLLALCGSGLGIALALAAVRLFKSIGGNAVPRLDSVTTGWPILAAGLASALVAALLAGILPALRATSFDPIDALKSAGPKTSAALGERRLLRGVTLVQTALTLALLVGAGLLVRTMIHLANVSSGFDTSHILTMSVTAVQGDYSDFHQRALERVAALPGVQHVAFAWGVPLTGNNWPANIEVEGQPPAAHPSERIPMPLRAVTTDYFNLLGLALAEGRDFRSTDTRKAPAVAIVNRAFADRYFPRSGAIGKKIWLGDRQQPPNEIVGIVNNGRTDDLTRAALPEVYLCLWQASAFSKHLVVRTTADPRTAIAAIQRELRGVDPTVAAENPRTLDQIRAGSLASRSFAMDLLVGFAIVGSVLTLIGIYGVLSLSVASRRRELAIRSAVGAAQSDIRNLVLGEGLRLIAAGVVAGILAALALSRALKSFLFGVEATDPATLIAVALLFTIVALLACWVPTRRAAAVDPAEALRL